MSAVRELSCQELVELVTDYGEGALPADERRRFDWHLEQCPGCRIYLEQLRTTLRLAGASRDTLADQPAVQQLVTVFRDWKRGA